MCSLHLTHPSTRSLVLGAVGSYCTAPGKQWEWGGKGVVRCLAQGHHSRAGGELGPLQVAVHTPYFRSGRGLEPVTLQLPVQALTDWATAAPNLCKCSHIHRVNANDAHADIHLGGFPYRDFVNCVLKLEFFTFSSENSKRCVITSPTCCGSVRSL